MDPNDLRDCVEKAIKELIEPVAWKRCEVVNKAEQESLQDDPHEVEGAMTITFDSLRAKFEPMGLCPRRIHG